MPKIVDPVTRREELAEAVWRVIRRDGLENASVRNIAREAGLSMGSLRHYFATQSELLAWSMRLVSDRTRRRIAALDLSGDPRTAARRLIEQLLPLDAERRAETEVWLAFTAKTLTDPALRALGDEVYDALADTFRRIVDALAEAGLLAAPYDRAVEAERLYALVDGLAIHMMTRPQRAPAELVAAVLGRHLEQVCPAAR